MKFGDNMTITEKLLELKDEKNAAFQAKLTPGIDRELFLGIRLPVLRELEKSIRNTPEADCFLQELPHHYYDENMLHAVLISNMKDYEKMTRLLEEFLPYVDNWAVCDTMRPAAFKKHRRQLMDLISEWIASDKTYTVRFGIDMLMTHFLDEEFSEAYLELPAGVDSEEYYVNMMIAWYYATALAKQWTATVPYIENRRLKPWVHNKTIQKAVESFRITDEQKAYLKTLKIQ